MKPFGLDTVLEHRKQQENIAKNRLFQAKKIRNVIREKLRVEKIHRMELISHAEAKQQEGIEIVTLIRIEDKISALAENIEAIKANLEEKSKTVELEQANLLKRSKERKVLERLKEEQNRNWRNYLNKKEAAMLDEIAIIRHGPEEV